MRCFLLRATKKMSGIAEFHLGQAYGSLPTTLAAGSAPGESGVSILSLRFRGGAYFSATPQQHLIWFHMSRPVNFACRIAEDRLRHAPMTGSLAICPAARDCGAEVQGSVDALVVM